MSDPSLVTPFSICTCSRCGPPWRDERPEPPKDSTEHIFWGSWMALCPTCGNKRCPAAVDHDNVCSGSNEPGQPGSNYPAYVPAHPEVSE